MFKKIPDTRALSERIISQISDAIISGSLKPGDRLPAERVMAEQFGVSRTVVRDAIKTLAGRGILQARRGAGISVVTAEESMMGRLGELSDALPLQGTGVRDLFDVRKVLEAHGAEWAALRRSSHHIDRLKSLLSEAREHTDDLDVLSRKDAQFHVTIAEASQNLVQVRVMLNLLDLLERPRRESLSIPGRPILSLDQHQRIAEAIEARDPITAREAMVEHLSSVEEEILSPKRGSWSKDQ